MSFITSPTGFTLTGVYVDLIMATKIKGDCNKNYYLSQTYSTKFVNNLSTSFERSGSPGYENGKRLLVAYNNTVSASSVNFTVPYDGMYMIGRKDDGTCSSIKSGNTIQSSLDTPILFGVNSVYSCNQNFNLQQFQDFCNNKDWKNLVIYNFVKNIQYIGIFGSSDNTYLQDWTQVIMDYDLTKNYTSWTSSNSSCTFPNNIYLDVLISKAGAVNNPQNYVVSAKLSASKESVKFYSNDVNDILNLKTNFIVNFIPLESNSLSQSRNAPNFVPGLPLDIATPLISDDI